MPDPRETEDVRREQILQGALTVASARGLDGLTVRAVAEEAGLSHGLVHFYFADKDTLVLGLLDRLLEEVSTLRCEPEPGCLRRMVLQEIERASGDRDRIGLFFDFWVLGLRRPEVRQRIRQELREYRAWFARAAGNAASHGDAPASVRDPETVASVAVAFVQGVVLQSIVDPATFDHRRIASALDAIFARST